MFIKKQCKCETGERKIIPGLDRPLWLQEVEALKMFKQSTHESDKVYSYTPAVFTPLPPGEIPGTHFY
jgi:hypothetical protein